MPQTQKHVARAVDRHKTRIGQKRKQIAQYVEQSRKDAAKCRTDAERATVLNTLLRLTDGLA